MCTKKERLVGAKNITAYNSSQPERVFKLCLLGCCDAEISSVIGITPQAFYDWRREHPELEDAVRRGRVDADAAIAHSMFARATGYSHTDHHVSAFQGEVTKTEITKHYPPDTTAAKLLLMARRRIVPDGSVSFVERKEITGADGSPLFTQEQADEAARIRRDQLMTELLSEGEQG